MTQDVPRSARLAPLVVITLVAGLLAAFLFIKFRQPDDPHEREIPGETAAEPSPQPDVPPVVEPAPEPDPEPSPSPDHEPAPNPRPEPEDPSAKEMEKGIAALKAFLDAGDTEGARGELARLRAVDPDHPELAAWEKKISEAERLDRDRKMARAQGAFREKRETLDGFQRDFLWDALSEAFASLEKAHPLLNEWEPYRTYRRKMIRYAEEARESFVGHVAEAKKALQESRLRDAIRSAWEQARTIYPEREEQLLALLDPAIRKALQDPMVFIPTPPPGDGWILGEEGSKDNPKRNFRRGDYYIDRTEVTNQAYEYFVLMTGHAPPDPSRNLGWREGKLDPLFGRYPVTGVTWQDACDFAAWAGKRLPTADEWEATARWLDGRKWPWGNEFQPGEQTFLCCSVEWVQFQSRVTPWPVGSFPDGASPTGVLDLAGNVWEWTATAAPGADGADAFRICKGGSYLFPQAQQRASSVLPEDPRLVHYDIGFRCVRDP